MAAAALSTLDFDAYYKDQPLYGGCFSKDRLGSKKPAGKFWVINMQDFNAGDGSHWVTVVDFTKSPLYIDPYGIAPPPDIVKFMQKSVHGKNAIFSNAQFQEMDSTKCGYFVIEFISELLKRPWDIEAFDDDLTPYPSKKNEWEVMQLRP